MRTLFTFALLFAISVAAGASVQAMARDAPHIVRDCPDCPEMVIVPGGHFTMGASLDDHEARPDELPRREVTIGSFAMGRYHVTREDYGRFTADTARPARAGCAYSGRTGHAMDPDASWQHLGFFQDGRHPVVCVTFADATDYAAWLSKRTGKRYRLPSEAEWEYAARGGSTTPYPQGIELSHDQANFGAGTCCSPKGVPGSADKWEYTSPVGVFPPNPFGLYDMQGNVLQWTADCYAPDLSLVPPDGSPASQDKMLKVEGRFAWLTGTTTCAYRVLRGGDWGNPPSFLRSSARNFAPARGYTLEMYRSGGVGFRVARALD